MSDKTKEEIDVIRVNDFMRYIKTKFSSVGDLFMAIPRFSPNGNEYLSMLGLNYIDSNKPSHKYDEFQPYDKNNDILVYSEKTLESYYKQTIWAMLILYEFFSFHQYLLKGYLGCREVLRKDFRDSYNIDIDEQINKEVKKMVDFDIKNRLNEIYKIEKQNDNQ